MLLNVWKEVCRHIVIDESVARVAPLLVSRLPLDELIVRHVDVARSCLETVAEGRLRSSPIHSPAKTECLPHDLDRIVDFCRQGSLLRDGDTAIRERLPGVLPPALAGHLLVAPLSGNDGILGVLIMVARISSSFALEHEALARDLIDPFTVALENDHRVRELITLREAVLAENQSLLSRLMIFQTRSLEPRLV
jgi:hypothetical protein